MRKRISRILHFGLIGGPKSNQLETNPGWTCRISRNMTPRDKRLFIAGNVAKELLIVQATSVARTAFPQCLHPVGAEQHNSPLIKSNPSISGTAYWVTFRHSLLYMACLKWSREFINGLITGHALAEIRADDPGLTVRFRTVGPSAP